MTAWLVWRSCPGPGMVVPTCGEQDAYATVQMQRLPQEKCAYSREPAGAWLVPWRCA
jgi:hypothetical protein